MKIALYGMPCAGKSTLMDRITDASWNVNYISDPELKAIGKEMQKVDPEDIDGFRKLYGEFQLAYNKKLPSLPMGSGVSYMFFNPKLKNFVPRAHVGWGAMVLDAYFEE